MSYAEVTAYINSHDSLSALVDDVSKCGTSYYVEDYYTDEIIDVVTDLFDAIAISKSIPNSQVTDDDDNVYYSNIDVPF